ncbi:MAG: tyrosine-type recombinase/integrase [Saprospiraceae bacterium]|nr:tyrosine-type recombinase/integrase [Saprospiraceae bacterium]
MSTDSEYIRTFQNYLTHEKRFSEHTVSAYLGDIGQFQEFLFRQADLPQLSTVQFHHVRQWVVELMTQGMEARTVNRKLSSLRTLYNFFKRKGWVEVNPTTKVVGPKVGKRLPQYLKEEEINALFEKMVFPDDWLGRRDKLVLSMLYECGLRRSELLELKTEDIDIGRRQVKVMGKGAKERIIPIGHTLLGLIQEYLDFRDSNSFEEISDYLILTEKGARAYPKLIYNIVVKYLSQVTPLEKRSPHILRHTFATHLTDRGAEIKAIKDLLGHASLAATQVYTHNNIEKLKKAYKNAHPRS